MDVDEYRRWLDMAERTVKPAVRDAEGGDYNWACFKAHQAAEFALKALLYGIGRPVRGHSATRLLREISAFAEVGKSSSSSPPFWTGSTCLRAMWTLGARESPTSTSRGGTPSPR